MGYHVTILRTDQGKLIPISYSEEVVSVTSSIDGWRYVEFPPTFEFRSKVIHARCGTKTEKSGQKKPGGMATWCDGPLTKRLNARVRGDELETYSTESETYQHPDDKSEIDSQTEESRKYKKRAKIRSILFRAYQLVTLSVLFYFAMKWLSKNL